MYTKKKEVGKREKAVEGSELGIYNRTNHGGENFEALQHQKQQLRASSETHTNEFTGEPIPWIK